MRRQSIATDVFRERYAAAGETSIRQLRVRVAKALAAGEQPEQRAIWREKFLWAQEQGFIPGGRIDAWAGAAPQQPVTLINCFVNPITDAFTDSENSLQQILTTLRSGGGVGLNFSKLAPRDSIACHGDMPALDPLTALQTLDKSCARLRPDSPRHGALMGVLDIDHPDILEFIDAKRQSGRLCNFNLSVGISDRFMQALHADAEFELLHAVPPADKRRAGATQQRDDVREDGRDGACDDGRWVYRRVPARVLWQAILAGAYAVAEPGVLFLDQINRENNLAYCETLTATNPCGEQPLPDYGACCLGSLNLTAFISNAIVSDGPAARANFDFKKMREVARIAVRMLDNVLDLTRWPLAAQQQQAQQKRRIGLGVTGLGDALILLGLRYDSRAGRNFSVKILRELRNAAYAESIHLAQERGAFPALSIDRHLRQPFIQRLPAALRERIRKYGIRNSHLVSIAPAGSISLAFADNVSNGIEPAFAWRYSRQRSLPAGGSKQYRVEDFAFRLFRKTGGNIEQLPPAFVAATQIDPLDHIRMVAALQPYVDAGISKTINIDTSYPFAKFQDLYWQAWRLGLKGVTVFRPNPHRNAVLSESAPRCRQHLSETLP